MLARIAGVGLETVYRNLLDTGMITQLTLGHCPLPFFFKGAGQWPCALSQWDENTTSWRILGTIELPS